MDWLASAQLFVLSQGILLCVIILSVRGGNRTANNILALYVGITTLGMVRHLLVSAELPVYGAIYGLFVFLVLQGPVLYLYVKALTEKDYTFDRKSLLHLICLIPGLIIYVLKLFHNDFILPLSASQFAIHHSMPVYFLLNSAIIFAYGLMALHLLESHRSRLENTFSAIGPITLNWLKWLIIFVLAIRLSYIVKDLSVLLGFAVMETKTKIFMLLNFGVIYFIAIGGLRQPLIFSGVVRKVLDEVESPESAKSLDTDADNTRTKYQKSALGQDKIEQVWIRLTSLFEEQQTYMHEDLNLSHLAELLDISSHELSQVINMKSGSNFYELVNSYRINKAKQLLEQPEHSHRKLLDIAMEVGYKSQSTFYSQFNKQVGMTPKRYRDKSLTDVKTEQAVT